MQEEKRLRILPGDVRPYMSRVWPGHLQQTAAWAEGKESDAYAEMVREHHRKGGPLWKDCHTDEGMADRIGRYRDLFDSIAGNGYNADCPILADFGLSGSVRIIDGHHRASICCALDLPLTATPRNVAPDLLLLENHLAVMYDGEPGKLYQPIDHPYFRHWRPARDVHCRVAAILADLGDDRARVLDIGACQGMVSFSLADAGHDVTASEINGRYLLLARIIQQTIRQGLPHVHFLGGDAFQGLVGYGWDTIVCLSVLHHTIRFQGPEAFSAQLQHIVRSSRRSYIELADGSETQMRGLVPDNQEELGDWIAATAQVRVTPILRGVPREKWQSGSDRRWIMKIESK